jgi:aspartyl-tRNA(Asn)/glutamyl-tRNA(Gln) amidotransferase subunit C
MDQLTDQLQKIMGFFEKISALPTENVEPLLTPTEIEMFWREDEAQDLYSSEKMVQNAPSKQGSLFKVPPVV